MIKKFNLNDYVFSEDALWFKDQVMETLEVISICPCVLEVTQGIITRILEEIFFRQSNQPLRPSGPSPKTGEGGWNWNFIVLIE